MLQIRETLEHRLSQTPDNPHSIDPMAEAISRQIKQVRFLVIGDHASVTSTGVGSSSADKEKGTQPVWVSWLVWSPVSSVTPVDIGSSMAEQKLPGGRSMGVGRRLAG